MLDKNRMCNISNLLLIDLIIEFRKGDDFAFYEIYKHFDKLIQAYSQKCKYGQEDMEQELILFFIDLIKKINLRKFKADADISLKKYITVCLRNQYIALSKQEQEHRQNTIRDEFAEMYFNRFAIVNDVVEDNVFVEQCLKMITAPQRKVIVYKYIYGLSDVEIGKMLNTTRQSVNLMKNRSLKTLREMVGE